VSPSRIGDGERERFGDGDRERSSPSPRAGDDAGDARFL
jgi:hypothetical protein